MFLLSLFDLHLNVYTNCSMIFCPSIKIKQKTRNINKSLKIKPWSGDLIHALLGITSLIKSTDPTDSRSVRHHFSYTNRLNTVLNSNRGLKSTDPLNSHTFWHQFIYTNWLNKVSKLKRFLKSTDPINSQTLGISCFI